MSQYITKQCPVCGKDYQADIGRLKHGRQTTCSRECSYKLRSQKLANEPEILKCKNCGLPYEHNRWERTGKDFCSLACYHSYRNPKNEPIDKLCRICGKSFHKRNGKYCSRKCFEIAHKEHMSGDGNPSYLDGRSKNATYDAGVHWREIRLQVYRRDNFICQRCGVKCIAKNMSNPENSHTIIQCHHIDPYKKSRNNDLSNLITVCLRCHRSIHNEEKFGKRNQD